VTFIGYREREISGDIACENERRGGEREKAGRHMKLEHVREKQGI